jgi:hypothetical protein
MQERDGQDSQQQIAETSAQDDGGGQVSGRAGWSTAFTFLARGARLGGKYEIISLIGRGSVGAVYASETIAAREPRAIKVLPVFAARDEASRERFELDAQAVAMLAHPHLVSVVDFGDVDQGLSFIVMESLAGRSLEAEMTLGIPQERAVRIARQICRAVGAAHQVGIAHGDLRAANVMLVEQDGDHDFVKVLDTGIANLVAPESPGEHHVRADLYSLGELCSALLSDRTGGLATRLKTRPPASALEMETAILEHTAESTPASSPVLDHRKKKPPLVAASLALLVLLLAVTTAYIKIGWFAGAPPMRSVEAMRVVPGVEVQGIEIDSAEADQAQIERLILSRESELVGCFHRAGIDASVSMRLVFSETRGAQTVRVLNEGANAQSFLSCVKTLVPAVLLPLPIADTEQSVSIEVGPMSRGM